ncbi:TPR-like protein [Daedalea quercina L-15889]|uniref:TPR-like protein n=1 Tax=Daedalea quercina L-15889 TaxID=1314783 RepID=A0A165T789_9APHY|nr:TPR-like protein [Daedalea quercina L-15889]
MAVIDAGEEAQQPSPDVLKKLEIAKEKKDAGDQAFKTGDLKSALRSYHESLLYLKGIDKNALSPIAAATASPIDGTAPQKQKTEADEIMEKIYSNMSACHLKQGNWKRAIETADKALATNEANYKALFRKAKALGETGYFEKAEKILEDLLKKNEADAPAINAELARLRAMDKEREKAHNQKFKGFLNKEKSLAVESDE